MLHLLSLACILANVFSGASSYYSNYDQVIVIDPNHGNDSEQCLQHGIDEPCQTLRWAFNVKHQRNSTLYILQEGTHVLDSSANNFERLSDLAFIGNTSKELGVVINCTVDNSGLRFQEVTNVHFQSITFFNCSALRYNTSGQYEHTEPESYKMYPTRVALYFYLCSNVEMLQVNISHSPNATGVIMYNTDGVNTFQNSIFEYNKLTEGETTVMGGGGGFYVEFTYCIPSENVSCLYNNYSDLPDEITKHNCIATYSFDNCTFSNNIANSVTQTIQDSSDYIIPQKQSHMAFGRGGGLSIMLKGNTAGNQFFVSNCVFEHNQAIWGGGMLVSFMDIALNNSLFVTDSVFHNNSCRFRHSNTSHGRGGGGMRIGHYIFQSQETNTTSDGNRVLVSHCNFSGNSAHSSGGGLSISAALQLYRKPTQIIRVNISYSLFQKNMAKIGAAIEVTRFPIVISGGEPNLHISDSQFVHNTLFQNSVTDNVITTETGVGTVYSNGVILQFKGEILFKENHGSALAVVGRRVSFENSTAHFVQNHGRSGGAINLLGVTYILVDDDTHLEFVNNSAEVSGGAINNLYVERENLVRNPNCFVRHRDSFRDPNEWKSLFWFEDNHCRMLRNDTIHTTSKYPCSWPGWNMKNTTSQGNNNIMCGENWIYYRDNETTTCQFEIRTEAGSIAVGSSAIESSVSKPSVDLYDVASENFHLSREPEYTYIFNQGSPMKKIQPSLRVTPGKAFKLPLIIKDDFGHNKTNTTVFAVTVVNSSVGQVDPRFKYTSGGFLQLNGISNNTVELHLDTVSERTWHVQLLVELLECPPGFVLSDDPPRPSSTCKCNPYNYQRRLYCDQAKFTSSLRNGFWMGTTPESNGSLVVSLCLPGFCKTNSHSEYLMLPPDISEICQNRAGILCGECKPQHGPAVNRRSFECVPCNDTNNAVHATYYVLAVYVPLLVLFTGLILFNVRLTTGPANAFIFYSQILSSTFDLTGDDHIPLYVISNSTTALLGAYRIPYGIFNLDFLENFIRPLCLGTSLSALDALQLDYIVAMFPLIMIFLVLLALKVKTCCKSCFLRITHYQHHQPLQEYPREAASSHLEAVEYSRLPNHAGKCDSYCKFFQNWQAGESLLHAFSAFLLLSYTKFAITSSYIVNIHQILSANGSQVGPRRAYYAGHYTEDDPTYLWRYYIPSCFIIVIIGIIPLMLLGYPIIWLEKCLHKFDWLWRLYPVTKIHVFTDTFQGCYRDDRRFFAAMYFIFRLSINVGYILTDTWLQQFVVQQIACTVFIVIFVLCWPYREEKWLFNYVDFLMLTNLAIVNALSLYLFAFSQTNHGLPLPKSAFVFQYILVFLPLIYMILYVVWYLLRPSQKDKLCELFEKLSCGRVIKTKRKSGARRVVKQSNAANSSNNPSSIVTNSSTHKRSESTLHSNTGKSVTFVATDMDSTEEDSFSCSDEEDVMLTRASCRNTYVPPKTMVESKVGKTLPPKSTIGNVDQSHPILEPSSADRVQEDCKLGHHLEQRTSISQKSLRELSTKDLGFASRNTKDCDENHVDTQSDERELLHEGREKEGI